MELQVALWLKLVLRPFLPAAALILLAAFWWLQRKSGKPRWAAITASALVTLLAGAAFIFYFNAGNFRYGRYINPHDVFHYYLGSKYSPELGYSNLYAAALVADHEDRRLFDMKTTIRSQKDYNFVSATSVVRDSEKYKALFSPARWQEFKKDVRFFQSILPKSRWQNVLRDKGYNATPVWNMVARYLSNTFTTETWGEVWFLLGLDLMLIAIMLLLVGAAFGWDAAMFATVFFACNVFMTFPHIKGGFLRLDWVTLLVMSTCMLKFGRYRIAGAMAAYAALARVFPVIFAFGLGAKCLWDFYETRRISRKYLDFFVVFAIVIAALVGLSIYDDGGIHLWKEFREKISLHDNDLSTTRVGFKYIFLWTTQITGGWNAWEAAQQKEFTDRRVLWWMIQAGVLALVFFAARRVKDHEALCLGYIPAFFLTAPTFYYHVMLIVPMTYCLMRVGAGTRAIGAAILFAISLAGYVVTSVSGMDLYPCFLLSWMLMLFCAYFLAAAFLARRCEPAEETAPETPPHAAIPLPKPILIAITLCVGIWFAYGAMAAMTPNEVATLSSQKASARELPPAQSATPDPNIPPVTVTPPAPPAGDTVEIMLCGDVMFGRNVLKSLTERKRPFSFPTATVAPLLKRADAAFCNLECAIADSGGKIEKRYTFLAPPAAVEGLTSAGYDIVSLANNHVLDFGQDALIATKKHLDDAGVRYAGIAERDQPQQAVVIERKGIRIGWLAYADPETPYAYAKEYDRFDLRPAKLSEDRARADIAALKQAADLIIISLHWGNEYEPQPDNRQRKMGRILIDAGAHIIAGHHPHVQQPPEWYKSGVIIYSMGNFVFDQYSRPETTVSRLYRVVANKAGAVSLDYLPLTIQRPSWALIPNTNKFIDIPKP